MACVCTKTLIDLPAVLISLIIAYSAQNDWSNIHLISQSIRAIALLASSSLHTIVIKGSPDVRHSSLLQKIRVQSLTFWGAVYSPDIFTLICTIPSLTFLSTAMASSLNIAALTSLNRLVKLQLTVDATCDMTPLKNMSSLRSLTLHHIEPRNVWPAHIVDLLPPSLTEFIPGFRIFNRDVHDDVFKRLLRLPLTSLVFDNEFIIMNDERLLAISNSPCVNVLRHLNSYGVTSKTFMNVVASTSPSLLPPFSHHRHLATASSTVTVPPLLPPMYYYPMLESFRVSWSQTFPPMLLPIFLTAVSSTLTKLEFGFQHSCCWLPWLDVISKATRLQSLSLRGSGAITTNDLMWQKICEMPCRQTLRSLCLSRGGWNDKIYESLRVLTSFTALESLECQPGIAFPRDMLMTSLTVLSVALSSFNDDGLLLLPRQFPNLRNLDLANCHITSRGLTAISHLHRLVNLSLIYIKQEIAFYHVLATVLPRDRVITVRLTTPTTSPTLTNIIFAPWGRAISFD